MKAVFGPLVALFFLATASAPAQTLPRKPMKPVEYQSPDKPVEKGKAPGLTYKLLTDQDGVKTYVLIFAKGDEVLSGLTDFATQQHIVAGHFSAIGAFQRVTTAWFDPAKKLYRLNPIGGPVELVSLLGDVGLSDGKPVIHSHISVGHPDGRVEGGHLIEAYVFPTVELFLTTYPTPLQKEKDAETDLHLFNLAK